MEPSPFSLLPLLSLPPHCTTQLHCWATKNVFGVDYAWSCFPNHLAYSLHVHYCIAPLWSVLALRHQYFSEQKWRYGFEPVKSRCGTTSSHFQPCFWHNVISSSCSPSPFLPSITPSLFHSRLKTHLFHKSFPSQAAGNKRTAS